MVLGCFLWRCNYDSYMSSSIFEFFFMLVLYLVFYLYDDLIFREILFRGCCIVVDEVEV